MASPCPAGEHARRAAATYGAAADHYNLPALSFWDRFGAATVSRLRLAPGHHVLDLCCGAGASALPAARAVGPAGRGAAVTTWGPGLFEPGNSIFWDAVAPVAPSLYKAFNPWDEITTPAALAGLLAGAGVAGPAAEAVSGQHPLSHPEQFWDIVLGSGYRATIEALSQEQRDTVRERVIRELSSAAVTAVRTDVVFGTAERPC